MKYQGKIEEESSHTNLFFSKLMLNKIIDK